MFRFFNSKKWFLWAWAGSAAILGSLWVQVEIDVKINEWFGTFYDMIQKALDEPNSITIEEYWAGLLSFITLAGIYVAIAVLVSFSQHISCLDGELLWLSGITVFTTMPVQSKVLLKEYKRTPLSLVELWKVLVQA